MTDDLLTRLTQGGPLAGWLLAVIAFIIVGVLYKAIEKLHEARLNDAKETNTKIMALTERWAGILEENRRTFEAFLSKIKGK